MKLIATVKGKKIAVWALILVSIITFSALLGSKSIETLANTRKIPINSVQTDENKVALTFDAAWGADKTSKIMDILESYGVKGTFFLVGFWVDNYPEKVKEICDRGHILSAITATLTLKCPSLVGMKFATRSINVVQK